MLSTSLAPLREVAYAAKVLSPLPPAPGKLMPGCEYLMEASMESVSGHLPHPPESLLGCHGNAQAGNQGECSP